MTRPSRLLVLFGCACVALLSLLIPGTSAQTLGEPEDFTAIAIVITTWRAARALCSITSAAGRPNRSGLV
jgi:hypothetical protein